MTPRRWPPTPLGDVLTKADARVRVAADQEYPNFGLYSFGRGLFAKPPIQGSNTSATSLFRARTGQFVYSRLFAFEGAYGIVTPQFDGAFVSNEFPLFDCDRDRVLPEYLHWFFRNPGVWPEVARLTTGLGNRRRRIKPEALLGYCIPLPDPTEQAKIVDRLNQISGSLTEATALRARVIDACGALCRSLLRDTRLGKSTPTPMHELVEWRKPDVEVSVSEEYQFAGIYCFGKGMFVGQRRGGAEFKYKRLTRLRAGELVYPKLMAWEGALAVVPETCDGMYVSPEYPVFVINTSAVFPEVLDVYFRSPDVWARLSGASTGTNVRRKRLNPKAFLDLTIPLPPERTQLAVRATYHKLAGIRHLHEDSTRWDAMLPAILERAFKGALA